MGRNDKRIKELEEQIRQLTEQLEFLIRNKEETTDEPANINNNETQVSSDFDIRSSPSPDRAHIFPSIQPLISAIKTALKINSHQDLEQKIGSIWASRIGAILVITAVVLGARTTFYTSGINEWEKIGIGYCFSVILILWERISRKKNIFTDVILSSGLTGIYFTTYAALFINETKLLPIFNNNTLLFWVGLPALLLCLVPMIMIAHKRESTTIAGVGLFLTYYSVALSCYNEPNITTLIHALFTSITIAIITFIFYLLHNWLLLSWSSVLASYATYLYVFLYLNPHTYFQIPEKIYFWISFIFLTTCFVLFSITCILDARKRGEYRKGIAPLVGCNSAIYFCLTFYAVRTYYLPYEYLFRSGFALMLLLFTILSHLLGPRNNYIFKIFIIKTIIMSTLAIQAYFSGEKLLIALSIECLALALAHKRSGYLVYRVMNFFLLWVTFFWGIFYLGLRGEIFLFGMNIPTKWFAIYGTALFLFVVSWFYEHFVTSNHGHSEIDLSLSVRWQFPPLMMSILHACIASILILLITLVDFMDDPRLPLILTTELLFILALGIITSTPAIDFSSVLLLLSAQVCYLLYYFTQRDIIINVPYFLSTSLPLAFISFIGAYAWEQYLEHIRHHKQDLTHFILSLFPYITSVFITIIVINEVLSPLKVITITSLLGLAIYTFGGASRLPSFSISGIIFIVIASLNYMLYLSKIPQNQYNLPVLSLSIALFLIGIFAERITYITQKNVFGTGTPNMLIRILFLLIIANTALFAGYTCLPKNMIIFYWLTVSLFIILLGILLHEPLYRWTGFYILFITLMRTFFAFQYISSEIYRVLSFAVSAVVLLLIGWIYSRNQSSI
ncbi:MAG TPA: DUF2339 domain-containing protein [Candidatus Hydrogenedens sp.]|nr:DUF2339 domain-containing protein [Candidatus Hydrogenedens sp.]HOK09327.1 DUF2339 domain-containing protein [Candidatus Hydrogenedens sp.]HOL19812.1 DUF2339 domain-containing protein [Candidatus Hydrogenedens sp.]HPP58603.1 DUF2339 domain-containing protein [Candidatus Hydrogenedens sp.]